MDEATRAKLTAALPDWLSHQPDPDATVLYIAGQEYSPRRLVADVQAGASDADELLEFFDRLIEDHGLEGGLEKLERGELSESQLEAP